MKKALAYGAGLLAVYLVVVNFEGASSVTSAGAQGLTSVIAAFQGRNA